MNINKEWQTITENKFINQKTEKDMILQAITSTSKSTISTLKKKLKVKINWVIFFILGFISFSLFQYDKPAIVICMVYLLISYSIGGFALWKQYNKMDIQTDYNKGVLSVMKKNLALIKSALKRETIFGLITFPGAIIVGVVVGNVLRNKNVSDILESFSNPILILIYLSIMIGAGFMAHYMNKVAYGADIKKLEDQISQLEELN
jgi:hypothetical protein